MAMILHNCIINNLKGITGMTRRILPIIFAVIFMFTALACSGGTKSIEGVWSAEINGINAVDNGVTGVPSASIIMTFNKNGTGSETIKNADYTVADRSFDYSFADGKLEISYSDGTNNSFTASFENGNLILNEGSNSMQFEKMD